MQEDLMTSLKSVKNVLEDSGPATLNSYASLMWRKSKQDPCCTSWWCGALVWQDTQSAIFYFKTTIMEVGVVVWLQCPKKSL